MTAQIITLADRRIAKAMQTAAGEDRVMRELLLLADEMGLDVKKHLHGGDRGASRQVGDLSGHGQSRQLGDSASRFTEDTAAKTGNSERAIPLPRQPTILELIQEATDLDVLRELIVGIIHGHEDAAKVRPLAVEALELVEEMQQ